MEEAIESRFTAPADCLRSLAAASLACSMLHSDLKIDLDEIDWSLTVGHCFVAARNHHCSNSSLVL